MVVRCGLLLCVTLLVSSVTNAEVYKWRDSDGALHFSDNPPEGRSSEQLTIKPAPKVHDQRHGPVTAVTNQKKEKLAEHGVEKTWQLFIDSLKSGDIDTAKSCLTPQMQKKFEDIFTRVPRETLRVIAESFGALLLGESYGDFHEAAIINGEHAGMVTFVKYNNTWLIYDM